MVSNPQASTKEIIDSDGTRFGGPGNGVGVASTATAAAEAPDRDAAAARHRHAWIVSLALFALGSALLLWIFRVEIETAITLWSSSDTYGYAFFVLPISIFLIVRKRDQLAPMTPRPAPWALVPVAGLTVLWMLADLSNIMVVQQLAFVGLWQALFLTVMGWQVTRAVLFPLAYLVLAVPLGAEIIPQLQTITAQIVIYLLRLTGMPVFLDGYYIQIPSGSFLVAEACSGLHFLIVCIALGILIAYLFFRSWPKRMLFVAISIATPIIANGLRAYGIIMLAHLSDYRLAADVDHVIYGFVFLSVVILVLIGIASLMRDKAAPLQAAPSVRPSGTGTGPDSAPRRFAGQSVFAVLALAVVLLGQSWASTAKAPPQGPLSAALEGPSLASGWAAVEGTAPAWTAQFAGPDTTLARLYSDGTAEVDLQAAYYAYQRQDAEALSQPNTLLVDAATWRTHSQQAITVQVAGKALPLVEVVIGDGARSRLVWYWYRFGDTLTNSRIIGKLLEMKGMLLDRERAAFVVAVSTEITEDGRSAAVHLERFLQANLHETARLVEVEK